MDYKDKIKMEANYWNFCFKDANSLDFRRTKKSRNPILFWEDSKLEKIIRGKYHNRIINPSSRKNLKILELGCGLGWLSLKLCQQKHNIDAYDISDEAIQKANSYYNFFKKNSNNFGIVNFEIKDLNKIKLPKGVYDIIFCHDSMHHVLNSRRLINEAYNALKVSGKFLLFDHIGQKSRFVENFNYKLDYILDRRINLDRRRKFILDNLFAFIFKKLKQKKKIIDEEEIIKNKSKKFISKNIIKPQNTLFSPFEDVTGREMLTYFFDIFGGKNVKFETTIAFASHWLAKIPLPRFIKYPLARLVKLIDYILIHTGFLEGEYIYIKAIKKF